MGKRITKVVVKSHAFLLDRVEISNIGFVVDGDIMKDKGAKMTRKEMNKIYIKNTDVFSLRIEVGLGYFYLIRN